ncbi:hypothetical protein FJTKL_15360 [Diaporthe vaccinii]|uniref:Uncharacterized protein n=1 Tax=Diaporthe vaccinii TaxID=105482 RepID=A0ABR4E5E1_9PEZI
MNLVLGDGSVVSRSSRRMQQIAKSRDRGQAGSRVVLHKETPSRRPLNQIPDDSTTRQTICPSSTQKVSAGSTSARTSPQTGTACAAGPGASPSAASTASSSTGAMSEAASTGGTCTPAPRSRASAAGVCDGMSRDMSAPAST